MINVRYALAARVSRMGDAEGIQGRVVDTTSDVVEPIPDEFNQQAEFEAVEQFRRRAAGVAR